MNNENNREKVLLEALKMADVECRFCAHRDYNPSDCSDCCCDCPSPCPCHTCSDQSNWEWVGFDEVRV